MFVNISENVRFICWNFYKQAVLWAGINAQLQRVHIDFIEVLLVCTLSLSNLCAWAGWDWVHSWCVWWWAQAVQYWHGTHHLSCNPLPGWANYWAWLLHCHLCCTTPQEVSPIPPPLLLIFLSLLLSVSFSPFPTSSPPLLHIHVLSAITPPPPHPASCPTY